MVNNRQLSHQTDIASHSRPSHTLNFSRVWPRRRARSWNCAHASTSGGKWSQSTLVIIVSLNQINARRHFLAGKEDFVTILLAHAFTSTCPHCQSHTCSLDKHTHTHINTNGAYMYVMPRHVTQRHTRFRNMQHVPRTKWTRFEWNTAHTVCDGRCCGEWCRCCGEVVELMCEWR